MKIGIAARGLSEQSGGVKQYIESITSALLSVDKTNEYYVFHNNCNYTNNFLSAKNVILESQNKLIWDYYLLPKAVKKYNLDLIILPKTVLPFFIHTKSVIVVHDLAYFMPKLNAYPLIDSIYMKFMIKSSLKRTDHIISVSSNTKKDIIKIAGTDEAKIKVISEAADIKYRQITDKSNLNRIKDKYKLSDKYIFYSGSLSPRKNMIRLLIAYDKIKDKIPHKLVLTGGKSWDDEKVHELIAQLGDSVIKLGHVLDEDMPFIYNLADLFVYPSLYEGFGLPPLEAMACGCPVVASKSSSIPEVVGDAAIMIDPYNVDEIADAMYSVLTDMNLNNSMIDKGLNRANIFSWEQSAKHILELIKEI
ncbi:MAG: glycosyltransferase family 1 protein [Candidatus Cloacimonetes bacterium]|nr:glycosyltransferase family 1 protein [Candidatus Cloacimonadota bacterium]